MSFRNLGDQNRVYYDIIVNNPPDSNTNVLATWDVTQNQPILSDPVSNYYLTVSKFTIPGSEIPVMQIPIQTGVDQNDPNVTPFKVTITGPTGFSYTSVVVFTPENLTIPVPPAPSENGGQQQFGPYYWYYDYSSFINIINTSFLNAWTIVMDLEGNPTNGPQYPPIMVYNTETQTINMVLDFAYADYSGTSSDWGIFMNQNLANYFDGFPMTVVGDPSLDDGVKINARYTYLNAFNMPGLTIPTPVAYPGNVGTPVPIKNPTFPNFIQLRQEYTTIGNWNCFKDIVFITQSIPVAPSFIPAGTFTQNGQNNFRQVLTTFGPSLEHPGDSRQQIQYFPQGPYRLIDLKGEGELRRFDVAVYWQDNQNNIWPINIAPSQTVNILFLFIRKNSLTISSDMTESGSGLLFNKQNGAMSNYSLAQGGSKKRY
jgi:hypothetical protein